MTMKKTISVYVAGEVVDGVVLLQSRDTIVVQMINPDFGIMMDAHIPEYAARFQNFDDPYGDDIIYMLLKSAYEIYCYTRENMPQLKAAYRELLDELAELDGQNLPLNEFESERYCRQSLFFYKWYKRYVPRCGWESILGLLEESLNRDLCVGGSAERKLATNGGTAPHFYR